MHLDRLTLPHRLLISLCPRPTMGIVTFLRKLLFHRIFHVETVRAPSRQGYPWWFHGPAGAISRDTFCCQLGKSPNKTNDSVTGPRLLLPGAAPATSVTIYGWRFQNITPKFVESWVQR